MDSIFKTRLSSVQVVYTEKKKVYKSNSFTFKFKIVIEFFFYN